MDESKIPLLKFFFHYHNDLQFLNRFKILNKKLQGSLTNVQTSFIHAQLKLNCLKENSLVCVPDYPIFSVSTVNIFQVFIPLPNLAEEELNHRSCCLFTQQAFYNSCYLVSAAVLNLGFWIICNSFVSHYQG